MEIHLTGPLTKEIIAGLRAGDGVLYTGTLYTARDAAHKRLFELIKTGEPLPFDVAGSLIYYAGPTPAKPGRVIGSAGPTTSGRMDAYTPALLDRGLAGMVGKGSRSPEVVESIRKNGAAYFVAIGGAAAYISKSILKSEIVCYEDLGTEAVRRLEVADFPMITVIDSRGGDFYRIGRESYLNARGR